MVPLTRAPRRVRATVALLLATLLATLAVAIPTRDAGAASGPDLWVSTASNRSGATPLAGRSLSGDIYVFVARSAAGDVSGIRRVDFLVDGRSVRVEEVAPFDLMATGDAGAFPYRTSGLSAGSHRVEAKVRLTNGGTSNLRSDFVVGPTAAAPITPPNTVAPPATTPTIAAPKPPEPISTTLAGLRTPRFADSSFWYQKIPADAPLHQDSSSLVASFDRQWRKYYNNVGVNTTNYAPPIFVASADTPLRTVRFWDCQNKGYTPSQFTAAFAAVPVPADARPAPGTDSELVIHQPSTDKIWEMWKARITLDGNWEACWGGRLDNASTSEGVFPFPGGTTATGLSLAGGLITVEELVAGRIDHALAVSLVEVRRGLFSWPANRTDGYTDSWEAIPEGLRLRLDPTIDVDALPITRTAKIVAKALQTYGMVIRDKSGSVTFYAENVAAEGRPDPYAFLFEGKAGYQVLGGIPWQRLQAMPLDYGKP